MPAISSEYRVMKSSRNMRILKRLIVNADNLYRTMAKQAESTGQITQVDTIFVKVFKSVSELEKRFQPMIAPTIAWEVETGNLATVIRYTLRAADKATINAPAMALTDPSYPSVCDAPAPLMTAPRIRKMEQQTAAVLNLIILDPTAVPNTLDASLAPRDQPRNNPLDKKKANNR